MARVSEPSLKEFLRSPPGGRRVLRSADTAYESSPVGTPALPPLPDPPFDEQPAKNSHKNFEGTAARATVWTIVFYGATQALRMGNNVILTHLLMPEYIGLITLTSTLVVGMTLLSDVGLLPSVINSPRGDDPIFLNTAWTIQIMRGLVLWLVSLMLAFPMALLYHDQRIRMLLPALAFSMVLSGFASTNLLLASRNIGVRRLLMIDLATQLFGMFVTILWARLHPSVWALIGGTIASGALKTMLSHLPFILPGPRNKLGWDKSCVDSLVHFGKWIMLGTAFYFFGSQADRLILGRLITFTLLGVYNIAFTIADIPRQVIQQFSYRVAFPFVAKMAHLPLPEFRANVLRYRFYILSAGALILSIVVNTGGWVILKIYDSRYHGASWMVPILALGLWHTLLYTTTHDILISLGKPKYSAVGSASYCIALWIALPIAFAHWGMVGAVVAIAAGVLPYYIAVGIGASRQKVSLWRQDAIATCMFAILCSSGFLIRHLLAAPGSALFAGMLRLIHTIRA